MQATKHKHCNMGTFYYVADPTFTFGYYAPGLERACGGKFFLDRKTAKRYCLDQVMKLRKRLRVYSSLFITNEVSR